MSKKHFIALAAALRACRPDPSNEAARTQWARDVRAIAHVCVAHNPAFRFAQFLDACNAE
jgi:hypothetical protein